MKLILTGALESEDDSLSNRSTPPDTLREKDFLEAEQLAKGTINLLACLVTLSQSILPTVAGLLFRC